MKNKNELSMYLSKRLSMYSLEISPDTLLEWFIEFEEEREFD